MGVARRRFIGPGEGFDESAATGKEPRICTPSGRAFKKRAWLCANYEAQDVLAEIGAVDLFCLEPRLGYEFKEIWQTRLMRRDFSKRIVFANPGLRKVKLMRDYDLFIVRCQTYLDLLHVNAIEGWRDHCSKSVCWIDEVYAALIPQEKYWIPALMQFDYIFVGFYGSVAPLSNAIGRPCHWLPGAVDACRFSPYPHAPNRVIDVYSIGRRLPGIHRALLQSARRGEIFYIYDTTGSSIDVSDHREHREHFAHVAQRSRYFMVAPGKIDCFDETQGQAEIGHRYFEGAAAGAVMIGQRPNAEAFKRAFPWKDAVIDIEADGSDVRDVLAGLDSDPARLSAIARRNAVGALLQHDWVYRWKEVLRIAGMEPSHQMLGRERRLKELAALVAHPAEPAALLEHGLRLTSDMTATGAA